MANRHGTNHFVSVGQLCEVARTNEFLRFKSCLLWFLCWPKTLEIKVSLKQ